jgi:transposase
MVGEGMRGADHQQNHMFSYLSPEMRVRKDHPLRAIRAMVDEVLTQLSRRFDAMYARVGRPSIPPEKLLRAQLLQMLYSIRSERFLRDTLTVCRGTPTAWLVAMFPFFHPQFTGSEPNVSLTVLAGT